jgi:pantothenate kinase type III
LLLGLLNEVEGVAAQVLLNLKLRLEVVREEVLRLLGQEELREGKPFALDLSRFTDGARKVMHLANEQVRRLNHEYIDTEHVLLGLIKEGSGVAANVLKNFNIDLRKIRLEVERRIRSGPEMHTIGIMPLTQRTKNVIDHAIAESQTLGQNHVGTEHILLGLLHEDEGMAGQVLRSLDLTIHAVRAEVLNVLGPSHKRRIEAAASLREKPVRRLFEKPEVESSRFATLVKGPGHGARTLVAVDIGNSRMKIGRFERGAKETVSETERPQSGAALLPEPTTTFSLRIDNKSGDFDVEQLIAWCNENVVNETDWLVASVQRGAADRLTAAVASWAKRSELECRIGWLTYRDVPLRIDVNEPERVGIDRLLGALAANRLREPGRAAIVVDLGSAVTVDLLTAGGAFAGGAILPGIAMSARALAEQTDALPQLAIDALEKRPAALGKSTSAAIEAGLFWGAVGAIRELVAQFSAELAEPPEIFLTGGASPQVAELLVLSQPVRHVPHLVLSGIALVADAG